MIQKVWAPDIFSLPRDKFVEGHRKRVQCLKNIKTIGLFCRYECSHHIHKNGKICQNTMQDFTHFFKKLPSYIQWFIELENVSHIVQPYGFVQTTVDFTSASAVNSIKAEVWSSKTNAQQLLRLFHWKKVADYRCYKNLAREYVFLTPKCETTKAKAFI